MMGQHCSFLEIHLAKNQKTAFKYSGSIPFVVATSYLTHKPIEKVLKQTQNFGYHDNLYFSQGKKLFKFLFSFALRALISIEKHFAPLVLPVGH